MDFNYRPEMSWSCRCGRLPEHTPWHCPKSVCGICKQGGHWAKYCPRALVPPLKPDGTRPADPAKTPEKTQEKTPEKTSQKTETEDFSAKTQPAETEMELKIESQAVTVKTEWGRGPSVPEYRRWKKAELSRECERFGLKTGPEKEMAERLIRLQTDWLSRDPPLETSPPKRTRLPFL